MKHIEYKNFHVR